MLSIFGSIRKNIYEDFKKMKIVTKTVFLGLFLLVFALFLMVVSCSQFTPAYVQANANFAENLVPDFAMYIASDPKLDQISKKIRIAALIQFMKLQKTALSEQKKANLDKINKKINLVKSWKRKREE